MATDTQLSPQQVWRILDSIPDPEIPVISLVELGIIRDVSWRKGPKGTRLRVAISPTYIGCPATEVIRGEVETALQKADIESFEIVTVLTPPWTTDWISPLGLEKLEAYGIAPPSSQPSYRCPRCRGSHTEIVSVFGSTPCKGLARCLDCREPFEFFKCS